MAGRAEFQGPGRLSVHVTVRAGCPGGARCFPTPRLRFFLVLLLRG